MFEQTKYCTNSIKFVRFSGVPRWFSCGVPTVFSGFSIGFSCGSLEPGGSEEAQSENSEDEAMGFLKREGYIFFRKHIFENTYFTYFVG